MPPLPGFNRNTRGASPPDIRFRCIGDELPEAVSELVAGLLKFPRPTFPGSALVFRSLAHTRSDLQQGLCVNPLWRPEDVFSPSTDTRTRPEVTFEAQAPFAVERQEVTTELREDASCSD